MRYQTPTSRPTRKMIGVGVSGAISVLVLYAINTYATPDAPLPAEVGSAIAALIAFVTGYFLPPAAIDVAVPAAPDDEDDGYVRRRPDEMA